MVLSSHRVAIRAPGDLETIREDRWNIHIVGRVEGAGNRNIRDASRENRLHVRIVIRPPRHNPHDAS